MREGIPTLLRMLSELEIRASFFLVMGPDNSGKAIRRIFTRAGFLGKMARTNPVKLYGLKTLLYGTLLPAPSTGIAHPDILRRIRDEGHEVALHAWDHVEWQDLLFGWSPARVEQEYRRGCEAFAEVFGHPPRASGTPGWQTSTTSLGLLDVTGVTYASDSRGTHPFYPSMGGRVFRTLQVPGTLPTVDELLGLEGRDEAAVLAELEGAITPGTTHVYTGHAEVEGMSLAGAFRQLLERVRNRGATFVRLEELAREWAGRAPVSALDQGHLPGRAGALAIQGRDLAHTNGNPTVLPRAAAPGMIVGGGSP